MERELTAPFPGTPTPLSALQASIFNPLGPARLGIHCFLLSNLTTDVAATVYYSVQYSTLFSEPSIRDGFSSETVNDEFLLPVSTAINYDTRKLLADLSCYGIQLNDNGSCRANASDLRYSRV